MLIPARDRNSTINSKEETRMLLLLLILVRTRNAGDGKKQER